MHQAAAKDQREQILVWLPVIGRIEEDNVEGAALSCQLAQGPEGIQWKQAGSRLGLAQLQVLFNKATRPAIRFDKGYLERAAADRFDPDRAAAGKDIQKRQVFKMRPQDVEKRLP